MAQSTTDVFDPNQYYRLTNVALGGEFSLDVDNPQTTPPNGSLSLTADRQVSGQIWQILELNKTGRYFLSSSFLGAKLKLDALINDRGDFAPYLRNYTTEYEQTWQLVPLVDTAHNRTTWRIVPEFLATGSSDGLALSVYNDTSMKPYLVPIVPDNQIDREAQIQQWLLSEEGVTIDDPTFSSTHLPALATELPINPAGDPTVTPTTTAVITATAAPSPSEASGDRFTGPLIAAAVVPTITFILGVTALIAMICMRRRKIRKMTENSPYSSGWRSGGDGPASTAMISEILDTFPTTTAEEELAAGKRLASHDEHGAARSEQGMGPVPIPSYLSVLSSNLSGSFRNLSRHPGPQDSTAFGLANPLSAPPPAAKPFRMSRAGSEATMLKISAMDKPRVVDMTLLPSPLAAKPPGLARTPPGSGFFRDEKHARRASLPVTRTRAPPEIYEFDEIWANERQVKQDI